MVTAGNDTLTKLTIKNLLQNVTCQYDLAKHTDEIRMFVKISESYQACTSCSHGSIATEMSNSLKIRKSGAFLMESSVQNMFTLRN